VIAAYERTGRPIVRAAYGDEPGHPVLFDRSVWPEVEALEGDRGARAVLVRRPERVVEVPIEGEPPADVDTGEDYQRLLGHCC
jgi:molybdenum cofactor cytidylyltransferase